MSAGNRIAQLFLGFFGLAAINSSAESLLVAVASNFTATAQEVAAEFHIDSGHDIRISGASTGKLFVQIQNGAPFDVLLAADAERPERLESSSFGVRNSRFTYAIGQLVLWSRNPAIDKSACREHLRQLGSARLAIANPDTAPYGAAARQTLIQLGLWDRVQPRLVIGENIAQTLQFVATGNASLGFVAKSQIGNERLPPASCSWEVTPDLHDPIEQQAILLERAANNPIAHEFLEFLRSESARTIIARNGYLLTARDH